MPLKNLNTGQIPEYRKTYRSISVIRLISPAAMVVYLALEYIVFSLQNTAAQTPCLKFPEGVEVSPLGNFSYSRFSKWPPRATVGI